MRLRGTWQQPFDGSGCPECNVLPYSEDGISEFPASLQFPEADTAFLISMMPISEYHCPSAHRAKDRAYRFPDPSFSRKPESAPSTGKPPLRSGTLRRVICRDHVPGICGQTAGHGITAPMVNPRNFLRRGSQQKAVADSYSSATANVPVPKHTPISMGAFFKTAQSRSPDSR